MNTVVVLALALVAALTLGALLFKRFGFRRGRKITNKPVTPTAPVGTPTGSTKEYAGKVAIVTGGGTGLGRSIAIKLAQQGAKVVIASRKQEHLDTTAAEITAFGGEVLTFSFDVREPAQVEALVKATLERFGKIDILVNNAAGNFVVPADKLTPNGWNAVIGIVLNGTWYCTSAVGKEMIKQGHGSILNIVANYAWSGYPCVVHSAAAKAGVLNMTRTLAVEWGYKGLRVNALAPGTMPSKGASGNLNFALAWAQKKIAEAVPLGRLTDSDEMAELALFLLSDKAAYVNGEVFTADGGAWLPRGFLDLQSL